MKKLFLMLALGSVSMFGFAQTTTTTTTATTTAATPKPSLAKIEFVSEDMDYGTIDNGANGQREFKFKNTGTEALIISTCRGSCGCTVPECPTEPIMPGKTGIIKVNYDTKRTGAFTKTVTVETNDPSGNKILKIHGTINPPAAETPPAVTPSK